MPETFRINVNGAEHAVTAEGGTPLLYILRNDLSLNGPKFGCGLAQCGACTAIVNGEATRTCVFPLSAVGSAPVVTLEGLGTVERPHPLQTALRQSRPGLAADDGRVGAVPHTSLALVTELFRDWTSPLADKAREVIKWYQPEVCRPDS